MDTTRRRFVGMVGLAAAGVSTPAATPTARAAANAAGADMPAGGVAGGVRAAFDFPDDRVPMNAANLCPSPRSVAAAVTQHTHRIDLDCSFQNRAQFAELLEQSRRAVAEPLGVDADEIALVRNTSEANNIINAGLELGAGDEVVLWDQNHPTNNVAWDVRAARYGIRVRRVTVTEDPRSHDALLEPFRRAIGPRTRVLSVTHVSNISGIRLPIVELGELCRQHGIHFHVDGAQSWGAFDLDLKHVDCDSFSASAHKWFMGPKEVGLLYVRSDAIERIWPAVVAPGWGDDAATDLVGARKFESLGQRDDAALAAVAEAATLHAREGTVQVEGHMMALAQQLKAGLVEVGATLVTPMDARFSGGVCIVRAEGPQRRELWDRLYREHGIIGAPTGGLRLCPHLYNTAEHVDRAIAGVSALRALLA